MFYHDHAFGITRLNVYAGEAAGYLISDATEQTLVADGTIPADQIPLVIQDRTFVPQAIRNAHGAALRAGPNLGRYPLGDLRRFLVSPRLYAGPESGRSVGRERLRALDVRSLVLAAGEPAVRADRQPVLHW